MSDLRKLSRAALVAALLLAGLSSCSTKPDAPSFDNPYDPNGTGPDPYQLTATVQADSVRLEWVDNAEVLSWLVFHSTTSSTEGFSPLSDLTITRVGGNRAVTGDHDFAPAVSNWYRLEATLSSGEQRFKELAAAAQVTPAPLVRLLGGGDTSSTRFLTLEVRSDLGESVELSNRADFASSVTVNTTAAVVETVSFTLPTVATVPTTVYVHARNRVGGSVGIADSTAIALFFTQGLSITTGMQIISTGAVVVDTTLVLSAAGEGVTRARVADSQAGLASAPWDDTPDSIDWVLSSAQTEPDTLFAEIESDLGVTAMPTLLYTPAVQVGGATLSVAQDLETTLDPQIQLVSGAEGASEMMLSEDAAFVGATWTAFADTTDFTLSAGAGEKTIFARYRNAFDPVGTSAVTSIFLLGGP